MNNIDLLSLPKSALITPEAAAEALEIATGTLSVWRSTGRYRLPFVKSGRLVRYRVGDLLAFIERRTQTHCGQQGV